MFKYKYLIFIILLTILILCISFATTKSKPLDYKPEKAKLVYLFKSQTKYI